MKNRIRTILFICLTMVCAQTKIHAQGSAEPFVGWTFDVVETPQYWYGTSFAANYGYYPSSMLYANGYYGSSQFATVTTDNYAQMLKMDWVGTTIGDPRAAAYDGYCLGIKHPNSNNRCFVMAFPTTLYHNLYLQFAVTRSNTGFKMMNFYWSLDGSNYTSIEGRPTPEGGFQLMTVDMSNIASLEDQPMVYIKVKVSEIASTAYQGNIKFDNLCIYGEKCMDTIVFQDSAFVGGTYFEHGYFFPEISNEGEFLYERRIHVDGGCDTLYQLYLSVKDTTTHVIPDTTDTTSTTDTTDVAIASFDINAGPEVY